MGHDAQELGFCKIPLLTCTVFLLGPSNSTRVCGVLKWYKNVRPMSSWANIKSPISIIPPDAFSSNTATSMQTCAGFLLDICGWISPPPTSSLVDALVPGSISIKQILREASWHVKAVKECDDPTYSGVITATAASPVSSVLYARPQKSWKVRDAIQVGGLVFKSQHWKMNVWGPLVCAADKENSQCSPRWKKNLRDTIRELGVVGNSILRVTLGIPEDQLLLYFSAFMTRRSRSSAVSFSRDLPWRPGSGRFRHMKCFWIMFNQMA